MGRDCETTEFLKVGPIVLNGGHYYWKLLKFNILVSGWVFYIGQVLLKLVCTGSLYLKFDLRVS